MQLQIPETELSNYKSRDLIPLKCKHCQQIFQRTKNDVMRIIKNQHIGQRIRLNFCSQLCSFQYKILTHQTLVQCLNCGNNYQKRNCDIKKSPNNFCSQSCAGFYNQKHKTTGYNRSKLENYLEENLKKEFPTLDIKFNDRKTLEYELDIYIPSKQLAFEINGIFHYKPIYKNYQRTIEIDQLKQKLCKEKQIQLHVLDTTINRRFNNIFGNYIFNTVKNIINKNGANEGN